MLKKYSLLFVFLSVIFTIPFVSSAQTGNTETVSPTQKPPVSGRPDLKTRVESRIENNENNRGLRQAEKRVENIKERIEIKKEKRDDIKSMKLDENASTSERLNIFKKNMRDDMKKKMEIKTFEIRKNALIKELNIALRNLDSVDERVKARIEKISNEGKNVTPIKALLTIAEEKLAKAKIDVKSLDSMSLASSTPSTGTSTTEVDLSKPRVLGNTAIKSVKDARDAFKKVVEEIAHTSGNKIEKQATTTPTTQTTPSTSSTQ